jgi:hypothetical protein
MGEYIQNPRRAPRARARCRTEVLVAGGGFQTETEDIGARGCQVVSPRSVPRGQTVLLKISNPNVPERLELSGRVAWSSTRTPWRLGISFDESGLGEAGRWFERLVLAIPGLLATKRIPDRIPVDATVYLGSPPKFLADFTAEEEELLRAVGSSTSVGQLMARFKDVWGTMRPVLFSLLAHGYLTVSRSAAVQPTAWKGVVEGLEVAPAMTPRPAVAALLASKPTAPAPGSAPTPPPARAARAPDSSPEPSKTPEPRAWARGFDSGHTWGAPRHTAPDFTGAGVGWRTAAPRTPDAQRLVEAAERELAAGRHGAALALFRSALVLAPGDPDIAAAIGKLAYNR